MKVISAVIFAVLLGPSASILAAADAAANVAELARQLAADDLSAQIAAAEALAELGQEAQPALPAMIKVLESAPIEARLAAARAVQAIGPPAKDAIPPLVKLLADDRFWVRERFALTTDGYAPYQSSIPLVFEFGVDFSQVIKKFGGASDVEAGRRYSPANITGIIKTTGRGSPDLESATTSLSSGTI